MNHLITSNSYDGSTSDMLGGDFMTTAQEERAAERAEHLTESLRKRWWYYLLVTLLAGIAGYWVASEFGSYKYVAATQVRVTDLPYPPGVRYFQPPKISDFLRYLGHPQVLVRLRDRFGIVPTPDGQPLFEDEFDRKTEVLTLTSTQETAAEAADVVNEVIAASIAQSTKDREMFLRNSLGFYNGLIGEAEADAASKRQAKIDRLEALRDRFSIDPDDEIEFEEVSEMIRGLRDHVAMLGLELKDADRLESFLRADEKLIVTRIKKELIESYRDELESAARPFTATSAQAKALAERGLELQEMGKRELATADELGTFMRDVGQVMQSDVEIPADYSQKLDKIREQLYDLENRRRVLPQAIEDAKQSLAEATENRAGMEISKLLDFENTPELLELTSQIERAETKVDQLAGAIDWVKGMLALEQPAFEQLTVATAEAALSDGNHKKLFAAVFGLVGLLLGMPILLYDVFRSDVTPSGRLGQEFGLPTMSAQEIHGRSFKKSALESHDPELRLLANRIQQSAREARGSVVLFSSLSDDVSTDELTRTIAGCLAAREEKVLIIDLESIDQHRKGKQGVPALAAGKVAENGKSHAVANGKGPAQETGMSQLDVKVGLAMALSGATKDVGDVLIEREENGVDRLNLGSGELPVEAFASPMMSRLLDRYRNEYSLVLLSGPPAKHLADLQVLSAKCDGTMFVSPSRGQIPTTARRTIMDLTHHHVPIMGIVEVPS